MVLFSHCKDRKFSPSCDSIPKLNFCCIFHTVPDFPYILMVIQVAGWPKILAPAEQESLGRPLHFFRSKQPGPVLQMHSNVMPLTWLLTCTLDSP